MSDNKNIFSTLAFSLCIFFSSCSKVPYGVSKALELAGVNKPELQKVIQHYNEEGNKNKLMAAYYLIENMPGKGWVECKPYFANGRPAPYYLFDYTNSDTIHLKKKLLEDSAGSSIVYNVSRVVEDIRVIKADFLIENIDYAFKAWQEPWAKHLNFNQFCEYILPYRFGTEPLQNWRKKSFENMQWIKDSIHNKQANPLAVCSIINDSLKRRFSYRHYELDFYPFVLSYDETIKLKGGRCDDLNLVAAYWMRSIGVPVINDFTPVWANSNFGGHTWLSVLTENGKHIPFNAAYDNPINDSLPFKDRLCKVYRRKYRKQENSFRIKFPSEEEYPGYLFTNNYYDVTKEYIKTKDIEIPLLRNVGYKKAFVYLGVLCEKNWSIVDVGKLIDGKIHFQNVGINTIYIAFYYNKDSLQIVSKPFVIDENLKVNYFDPDSSHESTITINIKKDYWWLRKERTYTLTYWKDEKWKKIGSGLKWDGEKWKFLDFSINTSTDSSVSYKQLPQNAIFRFQNIEPIFDIGTFGRPFIIKNGKYIHF